jgi:lipid A ethanolaminephosphotransferase
MLDGLKEFINATKKKDIFIVLHQMGNHGPAYYKRYPKEFEKFKPTCRTSELQQCSKEEIVNAYDNAIVYTDYFLSQIIALLKTYDHQFETALFYVSDHGESLGENNIYLHGLPYGIAPEEQRKVGAVVWLGKGKRAKFNYADLKNRSQAIYNHDYIFHTILGLFEIETPIYQSTLDILHPSKIAKSN